jgi:hypothetical protein
VTPSREKRFGVVYAVMICSAGPSPVSVPAVATAPAKPSNDVVWIW